MTNLDIAQAATLDPIDTVAGRLGLSERDYEPLGRTKAKLTSEAVKDLIARRKRGKLVLVTAITPTPAGEGKTTVTIGLAQGMNRRGMLAVPCTREPALGPIFGVKGGACGGGYSQVVPMEEINLFFNGDFPAVSAAHNLLAAMLDAHIHNGNAAGIDVRVPVWPRTVDMNDRALREITVGLGGKANGFPRQTGFVITPASEVMATLCLSRTLPELKERMGRFIVGQTSKGAPVTAADIHANGAMAALMRDAIRPNLVQTLEGGPALVHGGPFGNIAHGCSSVVATECALALADVVVTEAGFAADLGAEKFLNIVTRSLGRGPDAIVLVATLRAIAHHGSGSDDPLSTGFENVKRHIAHLRQYGPPVIVAINKFADDTEEQLRRVCELCEATGVEAVVADPWGTGGAGCEDLACTVGDLISEPSTFARLYENEMPIRKKIDAIVMKAYGGDGADFSPEANRQIAWAEKNGYGDLPICMAKTQSSLSDDPKALNAPTGFRVKVKTVRVSAGAGFLVAEAGDIMLMPGLGADPAALKIDVDDEGKIVGLF